MADIKKFLDQRGVSTLWTRIAEEVASVDSKATKNAEDIDALKGKVDALEKGTYNDEEVRNLIAANKTAIESNDADILALQGAVNTLNADAETSGSVANTANTAAAAKVAEIVAGADAKFDTLKEIADWILTDTTGAAGMAADIDALEAKMAGVEETVVKSIAAAIDEALKADGADKYALASELSSLADRVKDIEDAEYQDAEAVSAAITAAIDALKLAENYDAKGAAAAAETNAKAYADGLNTAMDIRVQVLETIDHTQFEAKGAAATAEANAKAYTDTEIAKIQALTEAEINAAIEAAKGGAQA